MYRISLFWTIVFVYKNQIGYGENHIAILFGIPLPVIPLSLVGKSKVYGMLTEFDPQFQTEFSQIF